MSIVPQSIGQISDAGGAYLRTKGETPHAQISLAYRRSGHSTIVRNVVATARRVTVVHGSML
jgi:hypothetical protein